MPSPAHEAFVQSLGSTVSTPTSLPPPAAFEMMRAADEALALVPPAGLDAMATMAGSVPAIWVTDPQEPDAPVILYLHGGGYLFLSAKQFVPIMGKLVIASSCRCLGIEYRRAPEHVFPAPVEDAVEAYRWLLGQGYSPNGIALVGDSAGGGLALAVALEISASDLPPPACVVAISPWTDLTVSGRSAVTADDPVVDGDGLRMMADAYLAGADPGDPRASPLHADLGRLPPTLVLVGTREALLDDARRFVDAAKAAGRLISLTEYPGVAHMWMFYDPDMPEATMAFDAIARFLRGQMPISSI
jgi:acetyl esterase/lipase